MSLSRLDALLRQRLLCTVLLGGKKVADGFLPPSVTTARWLWQPWSDVFASLRGSKGKRGCLNTNLECAFYSPPVDKEGRSVFSQSDVSSQSGAEMQSAAMQNSPVTFRWQCDILYLSAFKETAGLAACWQRQSTPFLCRTSLQMFTGTKHKRQLSVICLWSLKICKSLIKFTVKMGTVWRYNQSTKTTTSCLQMFC